jgi:hypothetical protein
MSAHPAGVLEPSRRLLGAAVAGLVGVGGQGCGATGDSPDAGGPRIISVTTDPTMTAENFEALCQQRGGYVQAHAVCAGTNSCKGISFLLLDMSLIEHSCRGMNACGPGMSCVELPADTGKTGETVYRESCGPACHSTGPDKSHFRLWVPPGTDLERAKSVFLARSPLYHESVVAFGVRSVSPGGLATVSMSPFFERYSRSEVERVIKYVHTLPLEVEVYSIVGWDAGAP